MAETKTSVAPFNNSQPFVDEGGRLNQIGLNWLNALWNKVVKQSTTSVSDSSATTVEELRQDFNALLAALRAQNIIK